MYYNIHLMEKGKKMTDIRSDKVILVDCDGVLLDWKYGFYKWMTDHGYKVVEENQYEVAKTFGIPKPLSEKLVQNFNESAAIGFLPALRDAVKYVKKLNEEGGYVFHCITSLSTDPYAGKLRLKNLEKLFGKNVFEELICLECGADKDEALIPYKDSGCFWVEDKPANAITGNEMGLNSILIQHDHNKDFQHENIQKVANWKEICEMIL